MKNMPSAPTISFQNPADFRPFSMAGEQGLEPQLPEPESGVLPLDDSPSKNFKIETLIKNQEASIKAQIQATYRLNLHILPHCL
jgi:hypothetical protein